MSRAAELVTQAAGFVEAETFGTVSPVELRALADSLKGITPKGIRALRQLAKEARHEDGVQFDDCETETCVAARAALEAIEKIVSEGGK